MAAPPQAPVKPSASADRGATVIAAPPATPRRWGAPRPRPRLLPAPVVVAVALGHLLAIVGLVALLRWSYPPRPAPPRERLTVVELPALPWPHGPGGAGSRARRAAPVPGGATSPRELAPRPPRTPPRGGFAAPPGGPPAGPAPAAGRAGVPGGGVGGGGTGTGLEVRPDPRLYVDPRRIALPEPTPHERYMAHLEARLRGLQDSAAAEAERQRRATDWTVRDADGRRWGVSPGRIHLGPLGSLPLPLTLGGSGERRDEAEAERRQRAEIDRQEQRRETRRTQEERARATRTRQDSLRQDSLRRRP